MDYITELAAIAQEHDGIIETKHALAQRTSKAILYKLCRKNKIHRVVHWQYIPTDDMQDELMSISKHSDQILLPPETVLFIHSNSNRTPFEHTIIVPSAYAAISNTGRSWIFRKSW